MDKADEITLRRKYFKPSALGFVTVIRKSFFSIATTFFQHYLKFIYLGGTTSYVPDTQPIPDTDDSQKVEQQDDIVIPETPEQTNDENRNEGNDHSIENKQMESGSDRYLISNISH